MKSGQVMAISKAISACKRCRARKIKCSHDFPLCAACAKAKVECVSLDPVTGREVSRSYIVSLEKEVEDLKEKVKTLNEEIKSLDRLDKPVNDNKDNATKTNNVSVIATHNSDPSAFDMKHSTSIVDTLNNKGVSFSKLMVTALNFKGNKNIDSKQSFSDIKSRVDPTIPSNSYSRMNVALLPPKQQALNLISLYFAQSNSQLPIFHRESFLKEYFYPIYGDVPLDIPFASSFTSLNVSLLTSIAEKDTWYYKYTELFDETFNKDPEMDVLKFSATIEVPKEYRKSLFFLNIVFAIASSIWHLQFAEEISDNFKTAALRYIDDAYYSPDRLEVMQAMLTHTLYSVMRPCVPGVWYLLGPTLRMCVDLELHREVEGNISFFNRDLRRRLFWCCYSLDRQVCVYLNRPFGIPEESIDVPFPSSADDSFITPNTVQQSIPVNHSSYKSIAISMFKVRILQAEIQSILNEKREIPRKFNSLADWLKDVSARLEKWFMEAPRTYQEMNCDFNIEFLDLNYNHCRVMLHGLSTVRFEFTNSDMLILAEASMGMILSFFSLWEKRSLNHTWAATQNVFMAGTSYLYAIFHSKYLPKQLQLDDVKKISERVEIVLSSLIDKCDAARECLEVYQIMSRVVIQLLFTNTSQQLQADRMQNLTDEEKMKTLQTGKNMNVNIKKLLNTLPDLMDYNKNKRKLEESSGNLPNAKRPEFQSILSPPTYDLDLNKFFEEVQKLESPENVENIKSNIDYLNDGQFDTEHEDKTIGECKKVYKMIHETGVESIWDQYFARPFYGEE